MSNGSNNPSTNGSTNNKRFFIDLTKSILPSASLNNKLQKLTNSNQNTRISSSPTSSIPSTNSFLLTSDSNSHKHSPTPSLTSTCSILSAQTLISSKTNTESCSHNTCYSTSCDCNKNSSMSSSSSSSIYEEICNSDDSVLEQKAIDNKQKNKKIDNSINSLFSTSNSSDSLNTLTTNSNSLKRTTRFTTKALKSPESLFSIDKQTSSTDSAQSPSLNANKKKCNWLKCQFVTDNQSELNPNEALIEHVKTKHINSQKVFKKYRCLWKGCNVYNNQSCSFIWLERHVIDHIDSRPFSCIFNGCNRKFRTEQEREKHVQTHITTSTTGRSSSQNSLSQSPSPIKTRQQKQQILNSAKIALIQNIKNKQNNKSCSNLSLSQNESENVEKHLKHDNSCPNLSNSNGNSNGANSNGSMKFQNYSQVLKALTKKRKSQTNADTNKKKFKKAQFKDYLDSCSIKVIEDKLNKLNYKSGTVTLQANIIGSKVNNTTGVESFLVEWHPKYMVEDEWVEKQNLTLTKQVSVNDLFRDSNNSIILSDNNPFYRKHRFRKNRRK